MGNSRYMGQNSTVGTPNGDCSGILGFGLWPKPKFCQSYSACTLTFVVDLTWWGAGGGGLSYNRTDPTRTPIPNFVLS